MNLSKRTIMTLKEKIGILAICGAIITVTFLITNPASAKNLDEIFIANDQEHPIPITASISASPICPADNIQFGYMFSISFTKSSEEDHRVLKSPTNPTLLPDRSYYVPFMIKPNEIIDQPWIFGVYKLIELGYVVYDPDTNTSSPISLDFINDPNNPYGLRDYLNINFFGPLQPIVICAES